jgi:hypothetical protein
MTTWCAIGAITKYWDRDGQLSLPADLGGGISLTAMPAWAKSDAALNVLSWNRRTRIQQESAFAFYTEYQADLLGTPDPEWGGPEPRAIQDRAREQLTLANLAAWLARPARLPVEAHLHFERPGDGTSIRESSSSDGLVVHERDLDNQLSMSDLALARRLNEGLRGLTRGGTIWTATRLLWKALQEPMWEARFVLDWVAMEALYGSSNPAETTFRLSQRVGFFLGSSRQEAKTLYSTAKDGYAWRSKAVHGLRLSKLRQAESADLLHQVETLLRNTFARVLSDPTLAAKFDSEAREDFLDESIFS